MYKSALYGIRFASFQEPFILESYIRPPDFLACTSLPPHSRPHTHLFSLELPESTMAAHAVAPIVYQLQQGLRNVDLRSLVNSFDLKGLVNKLDIQTVGLVALVVVAAVFLFELFSKSYAPYGRSLLSSAAHAWDDGDQWNLKESARGSRSLEPVTKVLDALAEAVKKWEAQEEGAVRHRASDLH
ncbi:uncharacterized protein LOC122251350 [Penaeus japonicus]|uniref:uncharacterized protein LOC122251350 n=1 Tax=Penaeus japonicus TaxID=27405 RepID=UPI001C7102D4|nr:uncharacterized protein LOC122251350 [Penaeus japonicus]